MEKKTFFAISGDLTVAENLQFFANLRGADAAQGFLQGILQATRLEEKQHALPDACLGGLGMKGLSKMVAHEFHAFFLFSSGFLFSFSFHFCV